MLQKCNEYYLCILLIQHTSVKLLENKLSNVSNIFYCQHRKHLHSRNLHQIYAHSRNMDSIFNLSMHKVLDKFRNSFGRFWVKLTRCARREHISVKYFYYFASNYTMRLICIFYRELYGKEYMKKTCVFSTSTCVNTA